ncbi:MAG: hypothetical protein NO482_03445 [Candidatus Methanomethylicia archaeon]|jgi:hypothetical protein|nr:hypothetical protein [Candidatus Methanomethylicia archaeon]
MPHEDQNKKRSSENALGRQKYQHDKIEFWIDEMLYRGLTEYCLRNSLTLEEGASSLIEKGIDNYWLMVYKFKKRDFEILRENFEVYRKDNERLKAIEAQNEELKSLLLKEGASTEILKFAEKSSAKEGGNRFETKDGAGGDTSEKKRLLRLELARGTVEKLNQFLLEKGFFAIDAIPVLIKYGLSSQDEDDLRVLKSEMEKELPKLDVQYTVLRFKIYQYFKVNQTLTMRLNILLAENRKLKEMCRRYGILNPGSKDEWDEWGAEKIGELYSRYLYVKRP